jgi:hypothetical protein
MAILASSLTWGFTYQTLDGANISEELVTTVGLASGANTVNLPANIVGLPLVIIPVTNPDSVAILVVSWSQVTMTAAAQYAWLVGTAYTVGQLVTYGGQVYVALDSTTGNIPSSSPTKWMLGGPVMTQVVLNAANTAASGCTLLVRVGTD